MNPGEPKKIDEIGYICLAIVYLGFGSFAVFRVLLGEVRRSLGAAPPLCERQDEYFSPLVALMPTLVGTNRSWIPLRPTLNPCKYLFDCDA